MFQYGIINKNPSGKAKGSDKKYLEGGESHEKLLPL
jgi:hypothetical protein